MINKVYEELDDLMFDDVVDAYNRREELHDAFQTKDLVVKQVYKWFFFCELSIVNYDFKSLLWMYITSEVPSVETRVDLSVKYKEFIKKQSKLKREAYEALEKQNNKEKSL